MHGHWLLATVARRYPNTELADNVTAVFKEQFRVNLSIKISLEIIMVNNMHQSVWYMQKIYFIANFRRKKY